MKTPSPPDGMRRVLLADFYVTNAASRPDRYLDVDGLAREAPNLQVCCAAKVSTDEELEERLGRWTRSMATRALLGHGLGPWVVLRHYLAVRRADVVVCHAPHHFWWVVLLHRLRLLPRGKARAVRGIFFRTTGFQRKGRLFREAPAGFQAAFATRQQVNLLAWDVPASRLRFVPWRIDAAWFRPSAARPPGEEAARPYVLCPGSAKRDEALVGSLVGRVGDGVKIVRVGRMPTLATLYQVALQRPGDFELHVNATHREYLRLLQNAALVILPIVPCDEPAGLTAALEALACAVPLLANESMGIGPLLREAGVGDAALLEATPDTAAWEQAIRAALARQQADPAASRSRWEQARAVVTAAHAIGPDDEAIRWLLGPA